MANSRNEDLLENMLGGSNEYGEPQSRNEAILQNILGEQNELQPPVSRIETLLLQLKDAMPSGEIEITENGEFDVTGYETATVNVAGGGITGGYTVTFKVNGNDYYIASCQQGEAITEPPTPTVSGVFISWQLNGADIAFPYTPSADVEFIANVATVHTEIEVNTAGEQLYSYSNGTVTKSNGGMALFGFVTYQTTQKFLFLVSQTQNAVTMSDNQMSTGNVTYNGETWCYAHSRATTTTAMLHEAADVGTFESSQGAADISKRILDYYFNVS